MRTVTVPIGGCNFASCGRDLEKRLARVSGIAEVNASYVSQTATITYDETRLTAANLQDLVRDCGFGCGEPLAMGVTKSVGAAAASPPQTTGHDMHEMHVMHAMPD